MLKEIQKCKCGNKPKFISSIELRPGHNTQTYICCKCEQVYIYDMIYPLVSFRIGDTLYSLNRQYKLE